MRVVPNLLERGERGYLAMKVSYDPEVDVLNIRFIEKKEECEVLHLSDQVTLDIGPKGKLVAIEILDATELVPDLKVKGIKIENLIASS